MITDIVILIDTAAIFFQGFFIGRKNYFGLLVASLVIISVAVSSMISEGMYVFSDTFAKASIFDIIFSFAYCIFWWILGYISSGFTLIRENGKYVWKVKKIKVR